MIRQRAELGCAIQQFRIGISGGIVRGIEQVLILPVIRLEDVEMQVRVDGAGAHGVRGGRDAGAVLGNRADDAQELIGQHHEPAEIGNLDSGVGLDVRAERSIRQLVVVAHLRRDQEIHLGHPQGCLEVELELRVELGVVRPGDVLDLERNDVVPWQRRAGEEGWRVLGRIVRIGTEDVRCCIGVLIAEADARGRGVGRDRDQPGVGLGLESQRLGRLCLGGGRLGVTEEEVGTAGIGWAGRNRREVGNLIGVAHRRHDGAGQRISLHGQGVDRTRRNILNRVAVAEVDRGQ